jgi:hypothetical protein
MLAPMFISKYQAVFRSRWRALLWAMGVCLTAYCTVPSAEQDNSELVPGFAMPHHKKAHHAVDPWAVEKPAKSHG